jgi:hypothetical protein
VQRTIGGLPGLRTVRTLRRSKRESADSRKAHASILSRSQGSEPAAAPRSNTANLRNSLEKTVRTLGEKIAAHYTKYQDKQETTLDVYTGTCSEE